MANILVNLEHYFLRGKYASKFEVVISYGANILVNLKYYFLCRKYTIEFEALFEALFLMSQICQ